MSSHPGACCDLDHIKKYSGAILQPVLSTHPSWPSNYSSLLVFQQNMWNHYQNSGCWWWANRVAFWTSQLPSITNPYQLALKQAKSLGKNRYHIFDERAAQTDTSTRDHFIAANNLLHSALELGQVTPYFQGIYHNQSQKISKFEVLARIVTNNDVISPYHFINAAKLSGLLPEITRVMIDKSFKIMAKNSCDFSFNITEDDLSQNYLLKYLSEKTAQYKIKPQRIILEILEGVSATGKKNHIKQLTALKAKGYALAIDDFGTEYSNFERILELDIDYLKIDAKYIKNIDVSEKSYEITRAITFFAHNANIPCIAEFVHNETVQSVVNTLGIDYSQGYYFSEPAAEPVIPILLQDAETSEN